MGLRVIDEILELAPVMEGLADEMGRKSPAMKAQVKRAWPSVLCNAAEAQHRRGRKSGNAFDNAMGEAREARDAIGYGMRCGWFANRERAEWAWDRADKIVAVLYKLAN
jgi:four helix bundle protein